jgi:hypothetical protein
MNPASVEVTTATSARGQPRISWGAIIAGVVAVLVVQALLSVLGIGIGASTIDPVNEQQPAAGIGIGAGIWFIVSALIAFFVGGWIAGRLAGVPRQIDSLLHGALVWGLAVLLTFYLVTTAVGSLVSGAAGILGRGISLAGQGVAQIAPEIGQTMTGRSGMDTSAIKNEVRQVLRQTGDPALQPGRIEAQGQEAAQDARATASRVVQNPQAAEAELSALIDRIVAKGGNIIEAADREALVNVLVARTNMSRGEAEDTVARWSQTYAQLRSQWNATKSEIAEGAREVGDKAASGVAKAALWTFAIFLFGGAAAAFGGWKGTPKSLLNRGASTIRIDQPGVSGA